MLEEQNLPKANNFIKVILMLISFTLISKILGFFREVLIASKFGSGIETDAFFIALAAVTLFKVIITASINTTLIPILSEVEKIKGKKAKKKYTNIFLNITIIISILFIVFAWIITPYIIKLIAIGFEGSQYELTVNLMRIGIITILFSGIVTVYRSFLQSESLFTESALADISFNLVYIFFLVFLSGVYGIKGLMVASVLAVVSQLLIQLPSIRKAELKYKLIIKLNNKFVKKAASLIPPVILSVAVLDLNTIIDRTLGSTLTSGSVSALNYGNRLLQMILGIYITAISTVLYPLLSKEANDTNRGEFYKIIQSGINTIIIISIPAATGIMILADPLVSLVFERGEFDNRATNMTVGALVFYSIGLTGMSLRFFLDKAYYSLQDTKTPMINGVITVFLNIVLSFLLINFMEHRGLAFATSISVTITSFYLVINLNKKIQKIKFSSIILTGIKSFLGSLIMGVIIYSLYFKLFINLYDSRLFEFIFLILTIFIGSFVYLTTIYLLKVKEINWAFKLFIEKIKR